MQIEILNELAIFLLGVGFALSFFPDESGAEIKLYSSAKNLNDMLSFIESAYEDGADMSHVGDKLTEIAEKLRNSSDFSDDERAAILTRIERIQQKLKGK